MVESGSVALNVPEKKIGEHFIDSFKKHKISQFKTEFVELSFLTPKFTLIPQKDFSTDTAQSFLETTVALDPIASIRFNPIRSKKCVVCFEYNEEIEFFFENTYPFVNIIHNSRRILDKIPNELRNTMQLIFHENQFEMAVVSEQFQLYNTYSFQSEWDVLYAVKHYRQSESKNNFTIQLKGKPIPTNLTSILSDELDLKVREIEGSEQYALIS